MSPVHKMSFCELEKSIKLVIDSLLQDQSRNTYRLRRLKSHRLTSHFNSNITL